ncbi:hypothetical protein [Variovorax sp. YR216]|uniref:hypothetical protein n=1 Tax=Variovorax sp. YR216 TaxID=1882828 RepID=UPI000B877A4A|nr:hypothetical protein [Variovorax sp. YR216]
MPRFDVRETDRVGWFAARLDAAQGAIGRPHGLIRRGAGGARFPAQDVTDVLRIHQRDQERLRLAASGAPFFAVPPSCLIAVSASI